MQYVEGSSNCADSLAEEEDLQIRLENYDESVLDLPPTVVTLQPTKTDDLPPDSLDLVTLAPVVLPTASQDVVTDTEKTINTTSIEVAPKSKNPTKSPTASTSLLNSSEHVRKSRKRVASACNSGTPSKSRLSVQLGEARDIFAAIADRTADALSVLAESSRLQAEASLRHARNEEKMIAILERFAGVAERAISYLETKE
ncbi:uncharacterized protein LOC115887662 isoform X2 [Sitophilus oryzae]|nr:uncharacterized protein LOC115887662 isoform X2 [Sitophilus oryzae]